MTEIEYEVREQDLIAFNEHQMQNSQQLKKVMQRHQAVLPGILVVIALVLILYYKDLLSAALVGGTAIVWGVGVPAFMRYNWRKQIRRMYTDEEKACILGRYTLRLEPKALVEINAQGESRMPWSEVLRIEADKKYAFLFVSLETALIIPRATLSKGNLHEFVKRVDELIERAE